MITASIVGDRELVAHLRELPAVAKRDIDQTVQKVGRRLEDIVKRSYLRGPRPEHLGVVTSKLITSITLGAPYSRTRFESLPNQANYYVGTNVAYGALWEYGFTRKIGAGARGGPRTLSGNALARYIAAHPPGEKAMAARPFLKPGLRDIKATFIEQMQLCLKRAAVAALAK